MSRIGKNPITIPAGVEVKVDGNTITVKGAKGTLTQKIRSEITVKVEGPMDEPVWNYHRMKSPILLFPSIGTAMQKLVVLWRLQLIPQNATLFQ